jgi:arginine/lysine/ornithine decarboxylase
LKKLSNLELIEAKNYDISKILISGKRINKTGLEIYCILLDKYQLQMEMAAGSTVLAMTSIADTEEGLNRLVKALEEIDGENHLNTQKREAWLTLEKEKLWEFPKPEQVYSIFAALAKKSETSGSRLPFRECEGRISREFVYLYPPGIPLIVPGERISLEAIRILLQYEESGYKIKGVKTAGKIELLLA